MKHSLRGLRRRPGKLVLQSLEARETPAALITFSDVDGDNVTVKTTKGTVAQLTAAATIVGGQLQLLNLMDAAFAGTNVTISAKRATSGDGFVNVGRIDATGRDIGSVTIAGDLGQIDAGDGDIQTPAIKNLNVRSMGRFGVTTQAGGADLLSSTSGAITSLTVRGDFIDANLFAGGGISKLTIGGSLVGGDTDDFGVISSTVIGKVKIGGSIVGGDGNRSGRITSSLGIDTITIGGSVVGGVGERSGRIDTTLVGGNVGPVTIKGDLRGGDGDRSGSIFAKGDLRGVSIAGSLIGGTGDYDFGADFGQISAEGNIGATSIGGDVVGGPDLGSAATNAGGDIKSFSVGGSLLGGGGQWSAGVFAAGAMGPVKIGGDVVGDGVESANFTSTSLTSVTFGGSLIGGSGQWSAGAFATGAMGPVKIGGDVVGDGPDTANITSGTNMTSVTIGGSLIGGGGVNSGLIQANEVLGPVKIGHDVRGGGGQDSAEIYSPIEVKTVSVGGSVVGGGALYAGSIFSDGPMGMVKIGHDLRGGTGVQSGVVEAVGNLAGVTIGGSVHSGVGTLSGSIMSDVTLQKVTIRGSVVGTAAVPVQISGRGTVANLKGIGSLSIFGSAEYLNVLAGYNDAAAVFGDAQIGSVTVNGDWISGNIVAGVGAGIDLMFGTLDDVLIAGGGADVAQIGSITIKGQLLGTIGAGDNFGFVAEKIGKLKIGATNYSLLAGVDIIALGATTDFSAREDV